MLEYSRNSKIYALYMVEVPINGFGLNVAFTNSNLVCGPEDLHLIPIGGIRTKDKRRVAIKLKLTCSYGAVKIGVTENCRR